MEVPPIVKMEEPPFVKKELVPFVKKEAAPLIKMEVAPLVKMEAAPVAESQEAPSRKVKETPLGALGEASIWKIEDTSGKVPGDPVLQTSPQGPQLERPPRPQTTIQGVTLTKMEPGDDPEVFLLAFESAASGALWPKEQWAMRLAPFLSEEAYAIYQALPFYTAEDYDQLKEAILDHMSMIEESYRKKFRSVTFTTGAKPRMVALHLRDLGRKWLKPEIRSPEEMLEHIVIEQFIKILPTQAAEWLTRQNVRTLDRAVQLVEGYLAGEAVGRACKEGTPKAWLSSWDGAQHTEGMMHVEFGYCVHEVIWEG
ncbi:uncharacterized protein [Ambystoma mexicanum]|uniref:uncharacterized protein n=1 Tax=Ambystoma mexicanum TaxID=8296 RepID=UPI0037E91CCB